MSKRGLLAYEPFRIRPVPGAVICDKNFYARNMPGPQGNTWFVNQKTGNDSWIGRSWEKPLLTIQEAIDRSNDQIDWTESPWNVDNWIYVAPGVYAEALTPPYTCHIIGMGVPGTDSAAEIHPATGSCLAGTGLGLHLKNLRFEVTEVDKDTIDFGICNNTVIEDCEIVCGIAAGGAASAFISTENCTHLVVRNCSFQYGGGGNPHMYGMYFGGGADKYAHHADIRNNIFQGIRSAGTGIFIHAQCTASQAVIRDNIIKIAGVAKGIDDNNGGSLCVSNHISIGGAGDAIEHAGGAGMTLGNIVVVNGTGAWETLLPSV